MKQIFTLMLSAAVAVAASAASPKMPATLDARKALGIEKSRVELRERFAAKKAVKASSKANPIKLDIPSLRKAAPHLQPLAASEAGEVISDVSFACLTEGSLEAPVAIELDYYGCIPEEIIGEENYGYGGEDLYQAGGQLYIPITDYSCLFTPDFHSGAKFTVTMDILCTSAASDDFVALIYDSATYDYFDYAFAEITDEWNTYTFVLDSDVAGVSDYIYFLFYSYETDIAIKNVKIEALYPSVATPEALDFTDYTGTSFKANWEAIDGIDDYYLTVGELDYETEELVEPYLIDNLLVHDTSYEVTGIEPGKMYAYYVVAGKGDDRSNASNYIIMDLIPAPENIVATYDTANETINITWDEVPGANYYSVDLYKSHTAEADEPAYVIADGDFSDTVSSGTIANPEISDEWSVEPEGMPGWNFLFPAYADGAIGIADDEIMSIFGYYSSIQSSEIDLTEAESITVEANVASGTNSAIAICYYIDVDGEYEMADYKISDYLTTDFTKVTATFKGGDKGLIYIIGLNPPSEEEEMSVKADDDDEDYDDYGSDLAQLMFSSLKATASLKSGSTITFGYGNEGVEDTHASFEVPTDDATYGTTVTAYQLDDYGYEVLYGITSDMVTVTSPTGIKTVAVDNSNAPVEYFNLQGIRVARPDAAGIYVRRQGSNVAKVVVK